MSLKSLLNQNILLYSKSGYDRYGRETVGSSTEYRARVQRVSKARLLPTGEQVLVTAIAYLDEEDLTVNNDDKVTYDSQDYKVFSVTTQIDGQGNQHHIKLELIKWQNS